MKPLRDISISILLLSTINIFGQKSYFDTAYYEYLKEKRIERFGTFNKDENVWYLYKFNWDGSLNELSRYDSSRSYLKDSVIGFHLNHNVAWRLNYKEGYLHGLFSEYYKDGKPKRSGYFYNSFKVGQWNEYYSSGQLKSESYFEISKKDSNDGNPIVNPNEDQLCYDKIIWGGMDTTIRENKSHYFGPTTKQFPFITSFRTGTWKYFDLKGRLTKKVKYKDIKKNIRSCPET